MALYESIGGEDGSPAIRVSRGVETSTRTEYPYWKDGVEGTAEISERIATAVDQYVACTKDACEAEADVLALRALFPIGEQQVSGRYWEDSRVVGSYIFEKSYVTRRERITSFTEGPPEEAEEA